MSKAKHLRGGGLSTVSSKAAIARLGRSRAVRWQPQSKTERAWERWWERSRTPEAKGPR